MKIRNGFVTNSSSSSFIVTVDPSIIDIEIATGNDLITATLLNSILADGDRYSETRCIEIESVDTILKCITDVGVEVEKELTPYYKGKVKKFVPPDEWSDKEEADQVRDIYRQIFNDLEEGFKVFCIDGERESSQMSALKLFEGKKFDKLKVKMIWE